MDLRRITDFDAPELDVYARLTENQLLNRADPQNALFVAESPLVIGRALDAGCAPVSFLMETKHVTGKGAALLARCPGVPVYAAEEDVLTNLTGFHLTRGMLCAMRRPPHGAEHPAREMKAREVCQHILLRRVDRHAGAAGEQRRALAGHVLRLHQKRYRRASRVQRPADDQRAFRHEQGVLRVGPVEQLIFRQAGVHVQLRRVKVGDPAQIHNFFFLLSVFSAVL